MKSIFIFCFLAFIFSINIALCVRIKVDQENNNNNLYSYLKNDKEDKRKKDIDNNTDENSKINLSSDNKNNINTIISPLYGVNESKTDIILPDEKENSNIKEKEPISKDTFLACLVKHCTRCVENETDNCLECDNGYELHEKKCYNHQKFTKFINSIKDFIPNPEEKKVFDYLTKRSLGKNEKDENDPSKYNEQDIDKSIEEKFQTIAQKFSSSTEMLKEISKLNERECRMKINQFTMDFQKNMEVLFSLSNFFEQKTFYDIEKTRNGIIDILNYEQGDPKMKLGLIMDKIEAMIKLINMIFMNIRNRIINFEEMNYQKILRMKNSYKVYLKKFLQ